MVMRLVAAVIDADDRDRLIAAAEDLGEWRVRTDDYRIVSEMHDNVLLVLVLATGHRRDIHGPR